MVTTHDSTHPPVVVLAGGLSHERDVSLRSGRRVAQALRDLGRQVIEADVTAPTIDTLARLDSPVVFPVLHGGVGEDGALKEVLALLDLAYVGSPAASCRLAFDKAVCTPTMARSGVVTPRQVALPHDMFRELGAQSLVDAVARHLRFPLMVKPSRSGSALGCTKVSDAEELPSAMVAAYSYGEVAVVEEFIHGTEVAVAVLDTAAGSRALPAVEIRPRSGIYDYTARYTAGETRFVAPADLVDAVSAACAELALTVHRTLGLRDLSRTDLIVRPDGTPVFLETNVSPGMTETSLLPLAVEATGLDFGQVCADLVDAAARRGPG